MHGNRFMMDKLMDSLINNSADDADVPKICEQMRTLGVNLSAEYYIVLDITFTCPDGDLTPGRGCAVPACG